MINYDYDFIGFTYNGKHSIKDLKIYRTSSGGRYDGDLVPVTRDKTASVDGMVGQYYFGTQVDQRVFNISFAFDNITDKDLRTLRQVFCGDGIHPLIFDEEPYKIYMAKVTSNTNIKHLCFDNGADRLYKGEGTVQFTCFYPYARTRRSGEIVGNSASTYTTKNIEATYNKKGTSNIYELANGKKELVLDCGLVLFGSNATITWPRDTSYNNIYFCDSVAIEYQIEGEKKYRTETLNSSGTSATTNFTPNSAATNKFIYIRTLTFSLKNSLAFTEDKGATITIRSTASISQNGATYYYSTKNCFAPNVSTLSGKIVNHYNASDYPSKWQWARSSGLGVHSESEITSSSAYPGDIPFTVKLSYTHLLKYSQIYINANLYVNFERTSTATETITWDTKTGLVTTSTGTILASSGKSCGTLRFLPTSTIQIKTSNNSPLTDSDIKTNLSDYSPTYEYDYLYY